MFALILIGTLMLLGTGCIAQQADLARIQKDLEMQITKIKEEKKALAGQLEETKTELATMKEDAQKAVSKVRSDLAPLNQQVKLLREQDLTSLYGKYEVADKRIGDLEKALTSQSESTHSEIGTLQSTLQAQGEQLQSTQTQTTTLAQQVDENNQKLTQTMTEFQQSLAQFKNTLQEVGVKVGQGGEDLTAQQTSLATQDERLRTLETAYKDQTQTLQQLREALEKSGTLLGGRLDEHGTQATQLQQQVTALQDKLEKDTQALRTYLENDVKLAMSQMLNDVETQQQTVVQRLDGLQQDMETLGTHVQADATRVQELSQSVLKLREAQEVMGSLLGKRGDDIIQQAGRLSERMNLVESHQSELTQKLQSNTQKTASHLQEVNGNLQALSQTLEQTNQSLTNRLAQQEEALNAINTTQLRESVDQVSSRLHDLEIHQSGLVGKMDADAQATNTHLKEVNKSIQSMAQALETVSNKLNGRVDDQERHLNQALTKFQNIQETTDISQANVNHLNQLTDTVNQLRDVVNTIGTKLGERVDEHEDRLSQLAQRVNRLQTTKVKK